MGKSRGEVTPTTNGKRKEEGPPRKVTLTTMGTKRGRAAAQGHPHDDGNEKRKGRARSLSRRRERKEEGPRKVTLMKNETRTATITKPNARQNATPGNVDVHGVTVVCRSRG